MSARLEIVPRNTLAIRAYERVRDMIVSGQLSPGAPIIETDVAAALGIQRSHLRHALQRLQHAGFVITSPIGTYSRTRVAPLTGADVQDLFDLVGVVEGLAARAAAQLPLTRRTRTARALATANDLLLASASQNPADPVRINDLDVAFHQLYVDDIAPPRVKVLHDAIKPQADRYERLYTNALLHEITLSVAEHEAIIAAIRAGDPDAAQYAVEVNWRNAGERFARLIAIAGERGHV
ncbi:MAG: GntR family transcriptional regulator [Gemmatimonadaceae bacterium]